MRKVNISITETLRQLHMGGQWEAALETCHFLCSQHIRIYPESLFLAADSIPPRGSSTSSSSYDAMNRTCPSVDDFVGTFCHPSSQPSLKDLYNRTQDPTSADIIGANMNYCSRAYHWNDALRLVHNCNDKGVTRQLREALLQPGNERAGKGVLVGIDMIVSVTEQHANQLKSRGSSRSSVPWLVVARSLLGCASFTEELRDSLPAEAVDPLMTRLAKVSKDVAPMCSSWRMAMSLLATTHHHHPCNPTTTVEGDTTSTAQSLLGALCRMSSWWVEIKDAAVIHLNQLDPNDDGEGLAARLIQVARSDEDATTIPSQLTHGPSFVEACDALFIRGSSSMNSSLRQELWCKLGDAVTAPATNLETACRIALALFTGSGGTLVPSASLQSVLIEQSQQQQGGAEGGLLLYRQMTDMGTTTTAPLEEETDASRHIDRTAATENKKDVEQEKKAEPKKFVRRAKPSSSENGSPANTTVSANSAPSYN